jgi:tripeptidyl-peptidase-1
MRLYVSSAFTRKPLVDLIFQGLGYPARNVLYTTGGVPPYVPDNFTITDSSEPYADWLNHILAQSQKDIPLIVSTSYGDDEQSVPGTVG